jgi:hypothetical protein
MAGCISRSYGSWKEGLGRCSSCSHPSGPRPPRPRFYRHRTQPSRGTACLTEVMSVFVPDGGQDPGVDSREDSSANVVDILRTLFRMYRS